MRKHSSHLGLRGLICFFSVSYSGICFGQNVYVIDTAFCKKIEGKNCIEAIPAGQSVRISDLYSDTRGAVVYFWGTLRNPSERAVGFVFTRQGECHQEEKTLPLAKIKRNPGYFEGWAAFFSSLSVADILGRSGATDATLEGGGKGIDVRMNFASIKQSESFRVFTSRNVHCAGTLAAVLVDSKSNQFPPEENNDFKTIEILE